MADQSPHILLVEDEASQREVMVYNLRAEGYRVTPADNGEEALLIVAEDPPDVIVLDWMMPYVSGIEVCRQLKSSAATRSIPIIMLSARTEEVDRVRGLETGADDYVVKPYSVSEFMARVRAQLRRVRPATQGQVLSFDDITLDTETHRAVRAGQATSDQAWADRIPVAGHIHGKAGARVVTRHAAGPRVGLGRLCRYPHRGRACGAAAQGAKGWRRRPHPHGARGRLRARLGAPRAVLAVAPVETFKPVGPKEIALALDHIGRATRRAHRVEIG